MFILYILVHSVLLFFSFRIRNNDSSRKKINLKCQFSNILYFKQTIGSYKIIQKATEYYLYVTK